MSQIAYSTIQHVVSLDFWSLSSSSAAHTWCKGGCIVFFSQFSIVFCQKDRHDVSLFLHLSCFLYVICYVFCIRFGLAICTKNCTCLYYTRGWKPVLIVDIGCTKQSEISEHVLLINKDFLIHVCVSCSQSRHVVFLLRPCEVLVSMLFNRAFCPTKVYPPWN